MDSVVEKLNEIETTAEAIVEQAETQKSMIEQEIQAKRDKFDQDLETETQEKLARIRAQLDEKMDQILNAQRLKNNEAIEALRQDFAKNHTAYAREILNHITEV